MDREQMIERASDYLRGRDMVWSVDAKTPLPTILAGFTIEQMQPLQAEIAELREALGKVKDALDYGRRHSHGMYAFTKMKEGYEKAEALIADVLDKHKQAKSHG